MLHPLDEFPIHQTPLSMAHVGTSDRNFYDRWYFNAHDRTGEVFLITGCGVYANVGVTDAFATVMRKGQPMVTARFSDALGEHRLGGEVGPFRVEVQEPLQKVRLVCDADDLGVGFDLTWEGSFPAVEEQPHVIHNGPRVILSSTRFAQMGSWAGELRVDGETIAVDPAVWLGSRDRSWGIRPIAEPDAPGRWAEEREPGFWWVYVPLRFDDFAVILIIQEQPDGHRTLNDATRVFADGRVEQLGWPRVEIDYTPGTRHPERARLHCTQPDGSPLLIDVETLGFIPLHLGCGYGDADWAHGTWKGRGWSERVAVDLADPEVVPRIRFGNIDHVARATCEGAEGWGLFEHASIGRHAPSGFDDVMAVAP